MHLNNLKAHLPALLVPLLSIICYLIWPEGDGPLLFYSDLPAYAQLTPLVGAALLHTNLNHLVMNLAAYWLIYAYSHGGLKGWRMPLVTLICGTLSTLGFGLSPTELSSLVGLSGALHGCLVFLAISEYKQSPKLMSITLLLVVAKVSWEMLYGASEHTAELIGASVAVWAHLWGTLAGGALAANRLLFCKDARC